MIRADTKLSLDVAVGQSLITLVYGLPRVGRTKLVRDWSTGREDTLFKNFEAGVIESAPIVIYDHFESTDIDEFIKSYRMAQDNGLSTRYVILPLDLKCSYDLHKNLSGHIRPIEVCPLQLSDIIAGKSELSESAAASAQETAQAQPTNRPELNENISWLRGGLPDSYEAESDHASITWRNSMLGSLLSRDYRDFGDFPAANLPEILLWAANQNGNELDEESCPLGTKREIKVALHVLNQLGLVRRLPNFPTGSGLNFGKKVKLYIRDTGILHALRGIETFSHLQAHTRKGDSWESHALEALILATRGLANNYFYRMKNKDNEEEEIDLVIDMKSHNNKLVAIEFKISPDAAPASGFYGASNIIQATDRFIVHSGSHSRIGGECDKLDLSTAIGRIREFLKN